LTHVTLLN